MVKDTLFVVFAVATAAIGYATFLAILVGVPSAIIWYFFF